MKPIITSARIRAILSDARTERDITDALRAHRIRYGYSTEGGYTHIRIPFRSGCIRVYRAAARSAPVVVTVARYGRSAPVVPFAPAAPARSAPPAPVSLRSRFLPRSSFVPASSPERLWPAYY